MVGGLGGGRINGSGVVKELGVVGLPFLLNLILMNCHQ